jgi:DNA-(apurinic or apyrimidinic site) lyase
MHVGIFTVLLDDEPLADAVAYFDEIGLDAVELSYGSNHLPAGALGDEAATDEILDAVGERGFEISAVSGHGNPIHPDDETAADDDESLRDAIRVAAQMDVEAVTCFSGLPGGAPGDRVPNWITAPWPTEHADALEYQWEVATEYWGELNDFADDHGVDVAIEMHPNMLVSEPASMLRLREATGDRIGANFDPSHLYWQGIDITEAIRFLGEEDAIHHFHAKDTGLYEENAKTKGYLDTAPYTEEPDRSWLFRSVGYGHGEQHWKDVVSTLRMVGYEGALSIEHEDSLTSGREGLEKAVDVLDRAVFDTEPGDAYWA